MMQSPPGPYTVIDGRRYLYFAGTGYLGLQDDPQVIEAICEAARRYGVHSATTRAGLGSTQPLLEVERLAAEFFDREDAFYFATGYAGNFILLGDLAARADVVFIDERAYFCLQEAAPMAGRPVHRFRHADPEDLRCRLRAHLKPGERPVVMSDGLFATSGAIAPVAEYARLLGDYPGAAILLDDAHAAGVLGPNGRGTFEHAGLYERVNVDADDGPDRGLRLVVCATLSKALGGYGGIIPGSRAFLGRVRKASHWFDCASAPPAPIAAGTARALQRVLASPERRARLRSNVERLRTGLQRLGLEVEDSPAPIIRLVIGTGENMRRIERALRGRGIAIVYRGDRFGAGSEESFRVAVFATHTDAMIDELLDALRAVM